LSHLHIPDGVLPWWLVALGWLVTLPALWLAGRHIARDPEVRRRLALLGVVSALVLVAMSTEIVPIAYHINLTVVAGILLGPWLSIVAAFVVDVILALIGHGGVTVVGLNTIMIATEMLLGWALFRGLTALFGRKRTRWNAGVATVATLLATTVLLVGIVALGGPLATRRESGALDPSTLRFGSPLAERLVANRLVAPESGPQPSAVPIARFATVVFVLGPIGWAIEAAITAWIVGFVGSVRPALVYGGAGTADARVLVGDEATRR
jgi:cobalt/nickel transport system permease protein